MTPFSIVLIAAAALSVQIMQTSTQLHKKKYRCASFRPLSQPISEPEARTSNQNSQYYLVPKSPQIPLSKSSSTVTTKSSNAVLRSPSQEKKKSSPSGMQRSLNTASRYLPSDSFSLFKLPLQLISKFLIPLTTKRNTTSVIAPLVNFNMPLTFSTVHSSNSVPCKTNSPIPCHTQSDTTINTPCSHQPCNGINIVPNPSNPLPCTNTSLIPCNSQQKESINSDTTLIYILCSILLNKMNNISLCNTNKTSVCPETTTNNPPITDSTTTETITTTGPTDYTTSIITTTDVSIPISSTTPTTTTQEPVSSTATTPKCVVNEPISSTPHTTDCTSDEPYPPCTLIPRYRTRKPYKLLLPLYQSKPCKSLLPHTSNAPVKCPHSCIQHLKLHPSSHSSYELIQPIFKPTSHKLYGLDQNTQDLLSKLIISLQTFNSTSNISTKT